MNTTPTNTPSTDTRASAQASDTVQHLADTARHLTDSALQGAQSAIQATRNAADQSLDKAAHSVQGLRESAEPAIGDLAAKAQALAWPSARKSWNTTAAAFGPKARQARAACSPSPCRRPRPPSRALRAACTR